jgi:hypothetical protein
MASRKNTTPMQKNVAADIYATTRAQALESLMELYIRFDRLALLGKAGPHLDQLVGMAYLTGKPRRRSKRRTPQPRKTSRAKHK